MKLVQILGFRTRTTTSSSFPRQRLVASRGSLLMSFRPIQLASSTYWGVGETDAQFKDSCVFFRPLTAMRNQQNPGIRDNAMIEIGTEEFLVAQGPPQSVRITTKHVNQNAAKELQAPFYKSALQFAKPHLRRPYSPFSISNESKYESISPVRKWVRSQLIHELPASVSTLVHLDDPMSGRVVELGEGVAMQGRQNVDNKIRNVDRRLILPTMDQLF